MYQKVFRPGLGMRISARILPGGGTREGLGDARTPPNFEKIMYIFFQSPLN